jgi:hypothetical protein
MCILLSYFKDGLSKDFMEPRDAVKDAITSLLSDNLSLWVVVVSVSYGMGIDCPHILAGDTHWTTQRLDPTCKKQGVQGEMDLTLLLLCT